jgi:hypothetical protein
MSTEHFTVDGTLIEAWAFRGERRSNATHESKTDPEARLARKGERVAEANGTAERDQALMMLVESNEGSRQITVGADKGYDAQDFVEQCRFYGITPHIAQNTSRRSAVDDRTTSRWVRGEPAHSQTCGRDLWLGEERRRIAEDPIQRRAENPTRCSCRRRDVQSCPHGALACSSGVTPASGEGDRALAGATKGRDGLRFAASIATSSTAC